MVHILYTAAHGGFSKENVPLGGGAAICDRLTESWSRLRSLSFDLLDPTVLGHRAPKGKDLVRFSEWTYADFCHAFEKACTQKILQHNPQDVVVLCNDVSEGPDFKTLAERGYRILTIYHVDVVDYVARLYLGGRVKPETLTRGYSKLAGLLGRHFLPAVINLVLRKQEESVRYSQGLIVPSRAMREVLLRCYPFLTASKIHVLPWGVWEDGVETGLVLQKAKAFRHYHTLNENALTLLTLSRISPEKGQDRLLKALKLWEGQSSYPKEGVTLLIAGEAAFMRGKKFASLLQSLAKQLQKTKVVFTGFADQELKQVLFSLANLYVFPSRHESYGLTALEAMRAGLPVLACFDHGTQEMMRPEVGRLLADRPERELPELLVQALEEMTRDQLSLRAMGKAAEAYARGKPFDDTAKRMAELLVGTLALEKSVGASQPVHK